MAKSKRRQRRKEDRPGEILQAAINELREQGFAGTKIESIAARAGVAKGTVYLYYSTKEEIFEAIVRARISPVFGQMVDLVAKWPGNTADLLIYVIEKFYAEMVENDERRMILKTLIAEGDRFGELASFYHREVLVGARKMMQVIVKRGIESGEFRQTAVVDEPHVIAAPAILAAIWKMTFESYEKLQMDRYIQAHIDLVLQGLCEHTRER